MKNYLEEYRAYYKTRMRRFENNQHYSNTYAVEKEMYETIASCSSMQQIREKFQKLSNGAAVALIKDEYAFRLAHLKELKENVRMQGPQRIIERASAYTQVNDLITMIGEEENKNNIEISVDTISPFNDFRRLENIEIYENAQIPAKYKEKYMKIAAEEKQKMREDYVDTEKNMNQWQPGWKFNFNLIWEERHRRLLPYNDEVIKQSIERVKAITNR